MRCQKCGNIFCAGCEKSPVCPNCGFLGMPSSIDTNLEDAISKSKKSSIQDKIVRYLREEDNG